MIRQALRTGPGAAWHLTNVIRTVLLPSSGSCWGAGRVGGRAGSARASGLLVSLTQPELTGLGSVPTRQMLVSCQMAVPTAGTGGPCHSAAASSSGWWVGGVCGRPALLLPAPWSSQGPAWGRPACPVVVSLLHQHIGSSGWVLLTHMSQAFGILPGRQWILLE